MAANRYVLEVPAEAVGSWAVLRRLDPAKGWVVVRLSPAPDPGGLGTGEMDAHREWVRVYRRVRKGELALVDPRGVEVAYRIQGKEEARA